MSLDVYLMMPGGREQPPKRIYVRRDGQTVEVTREEWNELYPGREPVVVKPPDESGEVYWANITHNMGRMAGEVGLYEPLWRPDELGITKAGQLVELLRDGLARLVDEEERLQAFNPSNGWGNYELLVRFTAEYLAACERWPEAEVEASR